MNILIDIGHPAHVHYFRNLIKKMSTENFNFCIVARDKDVAHELLNEFKIPFISRGKGSDGIFKRLFYMLKADYKLYNNSRKFRPDIFLSFSSPYAAQVSKLVRKPHIALDDTEHASLGRIFYKPFTDVILSPRSFKIDLGSKQIKFNSFLEMAYLHPAIFSPKKILTSKKKIVIMRFVSWSANHDIGHSGISNENKIRAVEELSMYADIFISSEKILPKNLEKHRLKIPCNRLHDALADADLVFGESATVASEAAMLGIPSIYIDNDGRGYTDELESRYGMVYNYDESKESFEKALKKAIDLLKFECSDSFKIKHEKILSENINVTDFLIWFIKEYPTSLNIMREQPNYQIRFLEIN